MSMYIRSISIPALLFLLGVWLFYGVTIDDAYISARYAKNLVIGNGLVFNSSDYVEGFSNPAWVFLTGSLASVWGVDALPLIGRVFGIISTLLAMLLALFIMRRMYCSWLSATTALILLASLPQVAFWSVAGLETSLYGLLILLSIALIQRSAAMSAIATGFTALTRPEGAVLVLSNLIGGLKWRDEIKRKIFWIFIYGAGFSIVFIPYLVFRINYFDALVPNTFLVKAGGHERVISGIRYVINNLNYCGYIVIILASAAIFIVRENIIGRCLILAMMGQLFFTVWAGGDWMPLGRFLVPVFFLATPLAGLTLNWIFRYLTESVKLKIINFKVGLLFLCLVVLIFQFISYRDGYSKYYWRIAHGLDSRIEFGRWLSINGPNDMTIAYGDMGALPFFSNKKFIDFHGLVNKEIGEIRYKNKSPQIFRKKIDEFVINKKPEMIIVVSESVPGGDYKMTEYGTEILREGLISNYKYEGHLIAYPPGLSKEYQDGRYLLIYLRNGFEVVGLKDYLYSRSNKSTL